MCGPLKLSLATVTDSAVRMLRSATLSAPLHLRAAYGSRWDSSSYVCTSTGPHNRVNRKKRKIHGV